MVGIVKEINGQKKIVPLTTDTGTGAPVGTLVTQYKKVPMSGYLYCDGSTFDENDYPALYMYLGTNVLPDYRECVMVGAEQNTTDTIATHDVYTQGEFKDDQYQFHTHYIADSLYKNRVGFEQLSGSNAGIASTLASSEINDGRAWIADTGKYDDESRPGDTTHGKQKAVYVYIKATSGLAENQQENVLNDVKEYAFDKSKIRIGEVRNGSANNDDWIATFDTPFPDSNYIVVATPISASGTANCPTGWYVSNQTATGFRIFCNGKASLYPFYYIAIHH